MQMPTPNEDSAQTSEITYLGDESSPYLLPEVLYVFQIALNVEFARTNRRSLTLAAITNHRFLVASVD